MKICVSMQGGRTRAALESGGYLAIVQHSASQERSADTAFFMLNAGLSRWYTFIKISLMLWFLQMLKR